MAQTLDSQTSRRWLSALLPSIAMLLLALYPQIAFWLVRGGDWQGAHAYAHGDEAVYASYVNALIDGRPRRSDPYTGRDERDGAPLAESYFSIQFLPPYLIASLARIAGASTSQSFIALSGLAALLASVAIFWLIVCVTGDGRVAGAGVLVVLCLGSAQLVSEFVFGGEASNNHLSFLRRYLPSAPFPFFFIFCALVWRVLVVESRRAWLLSAFGAAATFAALVYSYFYLWTTAAAWLACLALVWLVTGAGRERIRRLSVVGATAAVALVPYFMLLARRVGTTDEALLLTRSHAPDLGRWPEIAGALILLALALAQRRGMLAWRQPSVVFTAAFALTPFVVFNQQILTGRSLQPFHYGMFIVNYTTVLAAVLASALISGAAAGRMSGRALRVLRVVALAALVSGALETVLASKRFMQANLLRDEARPVALRLRSLAADGAQTDTRDISSNTLDTSSNALDTSSLVLATDFTLADALPNTAPQPVLWSPHMFNFPGVTLAEDRERLAQYLFFTGVDFSDVVPERFHALDGRRRYFISSLIRRSRHNPNLTVNWTPITPEEVRLALDFQLAYARSFDRGQAARLPVSYLLTSDEEQLDLTNFDRFYERTNAERVGRFTLYRTRLRAETGGG